MKHIIQQIAQELVEKIMRTVYTCTDYHRLRSILHSTHSKEE